MATTRVETTSSRDQRSGIGHYSRSARSHDRQAEPTREACRGRSPPEDSRSPQTRAAGLRRTAPNLSFLRPTRSRRLERRSRTARLSSWLSQRPLQASHARARAHGSRRWRRPGDSPASGTPGPFGRAIPRLAQQSRFCESLLERSFRVRSAAGLNRFREACFVERHATVRNASGRPFASVKKAGGRAAIC